MHSTWHAIAKAAGVVLVLAPRVALAADALWIQPTGQWYGIDGTWYPFRVAVGEPGQFVDLTVATALSETWVVSSGGCGTSPLCASARGGLFNAANSSSWKPLGGWQLGLPDLNQGGNGDYGLDTLSWTDTRTSTTTTVKNALVAAINDTTYFQGSLGIGANTVQLGANVTESVISQLAETYGTIPSHSYGYTAGAYYKGSQGNGTVGSLVLGGYDSLRFAPHDITFNLDQNTRIPSVLVRSVIATVPSLDKAPSRWNSTTQTLVDFKDTITAVIDTSTPYLWMPQAVCDRFATAFNLTWHDDYGVYLFPDDATYARFKDDDSLSFTFSLSGFDNTADFGRTLNAPSVVNITLSPGAFAHTLRYPFKNLIDYGAPGVPYFPLKRQNATGSTQFVLGRAFMQEAYMKMSYDKSIFSLHQALFPDNPMTNISVQNMERPSDSAYPAYIGASSGKALTTGQIVGIAVGAVSAVSLLIGGLWLYCRRRRRVQHPPVDPSKEDLESVESEPLQSPVRRMFSFVIRRKRSKKPVTNEVHGDNAQPTEVGADASHAVYELPVPPEPVELDSTHDGDDMTELGTEDADGVSSYEAARRKLERQMQGPVPVYTPSTDAEKTGQDVSPVAHYRPSDEPSPASSPTDESNTDSLPDFLPSPITPHPGEGTRRFDFPSPLTVVPMIPSPVSPRFPATASDPSSGTYTLSPHSPSSAGYSPSQPTFAPSSGSQTDSAPVSPTSPTSPARLQPPAASYQRTPIDPSRVVCLGPLPENTQLQLPQISVPAGHTFFPPRDSLAPPDVAMRGRLASVDTLGSDFTVDEERRLRNELDNHPSPQDTQARESGTPAPRSPRSQERIDPSSELIHVPQVADKRYSWEEQTT